MFAPCMCCHREYTENWIWYRCDSCGYQNLSRLPRTPSRTLWGWHEVFAVRVGLDEEGGVNAQRRTRDEGIASVAHEI